MKKRTRNPMYLHNIISVRFFIYYISIWQGFDTNTFRYKKGFDHGRLASPFVSVS
ncbi:hypothetical protein MUN88_11635 [Gracilibacillus caseinilyticus]|uniref:Uncharacterized protein n=1 Tax=Gracilibacillus caseinilyticus TaxID=2932256 RepID=A0ABY4ES88_9BACI|nr:hypothetical protein [Gracilibacillus caseinilyticus]UOQ46752.1 hypothetical protein MUN88_11635 [Gracilibacillus caseinilyticus]